MSTEMTTPLPPKGDVCPSHAGSATPATAESIGSERTGGAMAREAVRDPAEEQPARSFASAPTKTRAMESFVRYQDAVPIVFTGAGFGAAICGAFAVAPLWFGAFAGGVIAACLTAWLYANEEGY